MDAVKIEMEAVKTEPDTSSPLNLDRALSFKRKLEESFEEPRVSTSTEVQPTKKPKLELRNPKFSNLGDIVSDITSIRVANGILFQAITSQFTDYC